MDAHHLHYLTLFMFSFSNKAIEKKFKDKDILYKYLMATYRTRNSNLIEQLGRSRDGRIRMLLHVT